MAEPMMEDIGTVIVDLGSGSAKVGLGTDDFPRAKIPTLAGTVRKGCTQVLNADADKLYIGTEVTKNSGILDVHNIVNGGIISDWSYFSPLLQTIITTVVHAEPEGFCIIMTEPPNNPQANRFQAMQVFFEFNFFAAQSVVQANMVLYSCGMTTGQVIDSGAGCTHTAPIYAGYIDKRATTLSRCAGNNVDAMQVRLLGEDFGLTDVQAGGNAMVLAQQIKEKVSFVSLDYEKDLAEFQVDKSRYVDYTLPDGQVISIGKSRFQCPEVLFQPGKLLGLNDQGIQEILATSHDNLNIDMRKTMVSSLIVSGGSSMIEQFPQRITNIMVDKVAGELKTVVNVTADEQREYSVWCGASILSQLDHFKTGCLIYKTEYEEEGERVIVRKSLF